MATLATAFAMFQPIVTKERLRGRAVEALMFYQATTLRPLAEAARLLHCPQRRIFGLRYLERGLPAGACARIEALAFVGDLDDLAGKHEQARLWFDRCIARNSSGRAAGCRTTDRVVEAQAISSAASRISSSVRAASALPSAARSMPAPRHLGNISSCSSSMWCSICSPSTLTLAS